MTIVKYWCKVPVSVPWRSSGQWRDLRIWLLDNVASGDYDHAGMDYDNQHNRIVSFRFEKDATMFALRWS